MIILELLAISIIVCFIIDLSGVIDNIKTAIWKWIFSGKREYQNFNLKPFDCSLCSTFWIGLLWLICTAQFSLWNVCLVCIIAALTEQITNMLIIIKQIIARIEDGIMLWIKKQ